MSQIIIRNSQKYNKKGYASRKTLSQPFLL